MGGIGLGAAQKAVEQSQKRGGGSGGDGKYLANIFWKDDRDKEAENYKKVVRFLTDDIITCQQYTFVKGGEDGKRNRDFVVVDSVRDIKDDEGNLVFPELADTKDYFVSNGLKLDNFKRELVPAEKTRQDRILGLVVIREEVSEVVDGKRRLVVRDKMEERTWKDSEDQEHKESGLVYGVVSQSRKNFWNTLIGYAMRYGTLTDRDYEITQNGNGKDRTYTIVPLDQDPELKTPEQLAKRYTPPMTLRDWVVDRASYDEIADWVRNNPQLSVGGAATSKSDAAGPDVDEQREDDRKAEVKTPETDVAATLREELEAFR